MCHMDNMCVHLFESSGLLHHHYFRSKMVRHTVANSKILSSTTGNLSSKTRLLAASINLGTNLLGFNLKFKLFYHQITKALLNTGMNLTDNSSDNLAGLDSSKEFSIPVNASC